MKKNNSDARQSNDDTQSKLGDIYHYYLVLNRCLQLQEGEIIHVERYGDIGVESVSSSANIEVKHHINPHNLSDRHTDFWKTIRNWIKYNDQMKQFKVLILFTTSTYSEGSLLKDWNSLSANDKLNILKKIGEEKREKEQSFRELYNEIFKYKRAEIVNILKKTEISFGQPNIKEIQKEVLKSPFFKSVNVEARPAFIESLMGHIITRPVEPPHKWEISCEKFDAICCEIRDRFLNNKIPLEHTNELLDNEEELKPYKDRVFVKRIKEINLDSMTTRAINHYYNAQRTIYNATQRNPLFNIDLNKFQNQLLEDLEESKDWFLEECLTEDEAEIINQSKKHYKEAMKFEVKDFGTISPNIASFQKGLLHKIVQERGYIWRIKK